MCGLCKPLLASEWYSTCAHTGACVSPAAKTRHPQRSHSIENTFYIEHIICACRGMCKHRCEDDAPFNKCNFKAEDIQPGECIYIGVCMLGGGGGRGGEWRKFACLRVCMQGRSWCL
jgi:hypothetical protein